MKIAPPAVPVVTNVEATPNHDAARVRELLVRQVTAPVRWEESVERVAALGVTAAVELGAGKVLTGMVKRIAKAIVPYAAGDPDSVTATASALSGAPAPKEPSHG